MANGLPYYRMWVKDFDTNEAVRLLSVPEVGLFVLCLNHAWVNDGLPADPAAIAKLLKVPIRDFGKWWPNVSLCFSPESGGTRLRNGRQEKERNEAKSISDKAKASADKRWSARNTVALPAQSEGNARAYESVSVSSFSSSEVLKPQTSGAKISIEDFDLWWARWVVLTKRKQRNEQALSAWIGHVDESDAPRVMACLERYGSSDEVRRGIVTNADKWIYEQSRDNWEGDWPGSIGFASAKVPDPPSPMAIFEAEKQAAIKRGVEY